jgi:hypothetical protein
VDFRHFGTRTCTLRVPKTLPLVRLLFIVASRLQVRWGRFCGLGRASRAHPEISICNTVILQYLKNRDQILTRKKKRFVDEYIIKFKEETRIKNGMKLFETMICLQFDKSKGCE